MSSALRIVRMITRLFFCLIFINGCSSPADKTTTAKDSAPPPKTYALYIIEIKQMKFEPEVLTAHIGDTILFVNRDLVDHDVTEEKTKAWSSSRLANEKFYKMVVTDSASYYCALHPVMKGKIALE